MRRVNAGSAMPKAARRRAGRPTEETHARERLLLAGAELFGARGYAGLAVRDVAKAAGVQVATLYYHFPSKSELLQAVLDWVMAPVHAERRAAIDALKAEAHPSLKAILDAFVGAPLRLAAEPTHGALRRKLASVTINDPSPEVRQALGRVYDRLMGDFITLLHRAAPGLGAAEQRWALVACFGIMHYAQSDLGRMAALLGGPLDDDADRATDLLSEFIAGGFERLAKR